MSRKRTAWHNGIAYLAEQEVRERVQEAEMKKNQTHIAVANDQTPLTDTERKATPPDRNDVSDKK